MSANVGRTSLAYSRTWHHVDMGHDQRAFGRIATQIAITLMGKHKPIYDPSTDCGDYVVATGPGSLKEISMDRMIAKYGGAEVLRRAVSGMLPKNRLRSVRLERLKAFDGFGHPYKKNLVKFLDPSHPGHASKSKTPVTDAIKNLSQPETATPATL
ncbi:uncharacterized protein LAJ45_01971 [Morchella importuna]|uniref:uncharacterized protein n=1 Tax=Morchella importuna TaxID=1174673 RepID=UPI001E8CE464|nr:uncharacterized protein LAJ45_01971 [Morchella importuna]KAH8154203.1 hypothetical protein LAJ45_01971 [Morchella importuna]